MRPEALAAYVEGEVTPSEAAAIETALAESPRARRDVEDMRANRAALARPLPDIESIDIVSGLERAIARAETRRLPSSMVSRWRAGLAALGLAAGLAGAAGVVLMLRSPAPEVDEFRAKSAAPTSPAAEDQRWAGVQVFHAATKAAAPKRLGTRVGAQEGLLFAYTNLGPRPFEYLMIFAIDARGEVHWYHPAYERAGTNPTSLPLRRGVARASLPEYIRQELAPGPLEIRALFTRQPVSVMEVEAWVAAHAGAAAPPPWVDAYQQVIETQVEADSPP